MPASDLEERRMSFATCLYVILGGALGSLARFGILALGASGEP